MTKFLTVRGGTVALGPHPNDDMDQGLSIKLMNYIGLNTPETGMFIAHDEIDQLIDALRTMKDNAGPD